MKLKNNLFVRGLYCWLLRYRQYFIRRRLFLQCAENVIITPPPYYVLTLRISISVHI